MKCDLGMMKSGNVGTDRRAPPDPGPAPALLHRLLHLHEVVRDPAPGVRRPGGDAARALPGDGEITRRCATTSSSSSRPEVIPSAREDLRQGLRRGAPERAASLARPRPRTTSSGCWESAQATVRPRSTPTSAGSTTSVRSSRRSAAPRRPTDYYRELRAEVAGAPRPRAEGTDRPRTARSRSASALVVEGPPNWTSFREFWRMFAEEGCGHASPRATPRSAASTTPASGTTPSRPLESLAEYCLGCYTNLNLPSRIELLSRYVRGVRRRRPADQLGQELQLLQRRASS